MGPAFLVMDRNVNRLAVVNSMESVFLRSNELIMRNKGNRRISRRTDFKTF